LNALRRSFELALIMVVVWLTMLLVFVVVDKVVVPISIPKPNYVFVFLEAVVKLVAASVIALVWLGFWSFLVKIYREKTKPSGE